VVESNEKTVHLGVYDTNLAPVEKIDSGDSVSFPNTWSHFLNQMQPGVPVEKLAELRSVLERGSRGSRVDAVHESDMDEAMADIKFADDDTIRERIAGLKGR